MEPIDLLDQRFCRNTIPKKRMLLGVVGRSIPQCNFNGYIMFENISKDMDVTKLTSHSRFSNDVLVNLTIKSGKQRMVVADNRYILWDQLLQIIFGNYCLNEVIANRIEVYWATWFGDNGNIKEIKLDNMANIYEK